MCGFVGTFGGENNFGDGLLYEIGASAKHRGPDDTGFWTDEHYKVLFNRLAIIELSKAGRQPMCIRNWVIAFNGEIYNHREIRKRLPAFNYRGSSDTETLCFAIENWGFEKTLSELNGMFAIAAYNKTEKILSLARDLAGIKPLFYSVGAGTIWFASQFNQVVEGIGRKRVTINRNGMRDFLQLGYMQAPETIYGEIKQVIPGEIVSFDVRKRKTHKRYYELSRKGVIHESPQSNSCQKFAELMGATVRDQLVSDVPIGCFISSGIDSALVSGFASKVNGGVKTFTIGVDGLAGDERAKAKEYSQVLGLEHESQEILADQILNSVDDSISLAGEPFGDPSSIPTFLITQGAKKHNTVMLSGDGGDELFWGYPRWNMFLQNYSRFRFPRSVRRAQRYLNRKLGSNQAYGPGMFSTPGEWVLNGQSHNGIGFLEKLMPGSQNTSQVNELYRFSFGPSQLEFRNWLRWNEFYGHLQRVLTKVDRMSMANSLEVRVPFLDKRIIEFAWNKRSSFGERHFINKKFLKQQLSQFIPEKDINQNKLGFDIPLENWLRGPLSKAVKEELLNSSFYGNEFIDKRVLDKYVVDFYANRHNSSWGVWILFCWQKWGEQLKHTDRSLSSEFRTGLVSDSSKSVVQVSSKIS
jgi:asparagine synthase (glutamine-hydrolysing)